MANKEALRIAKLGTTSFFKRLGPRKPYAGKVKAVILDWSGTTADAHVLAPAVVFAKVFEKHGVPISMREARLPMGLRKDLHIGKILEIEDVSKRWQQAKGYAPDPEVNGKDVQAMFKDFVPMQLDVLDQYTTLLPGTADAINYLKNHQIKVGSSTGFTKVMVDVLLAAAKKQGYSPDSSVAGDEVPNNMGFRPAPFMLYQNLNNLGVWPIESVVKVDDTVSGVGEGLNAGCWGVGVAAYSNYTDVDSLEEWEQMSEEEKEKRREQSRSVLLESGAHYVIDSIAQLPLVVEDINDRLEKGERP
ncbi:phosphonoacetaldehyde hydrolase-like [Ciona intestinalis]